MSSFDYNNKTYNVDADGFLVDFGTWDDNFAEGMAAETGIENGLTDIHRHIIRYIHDILKQTGICPVVYETCRANDISLDDFKKLFPTGYLRGACKLAGVTFREGYAGHSWLPDSAENIEPINLSKSYDVDVRGFLVDPDDWDEHFAIYKAFEMKMANGLSEKHWQIIEYLRSSFKTNKVVPTVFETCEANKVAIDELETLFPDGYHRGAVKVAGLRAR